MTNLEWIQKGNTGCTFATLFSKAPDTVGWKFYHYYEWMSKRPEDLLICIEFPLGMKVDEIRSWALHVGFYLEDTSDNTEGLRIDCKEGKAWVQYFGPDSHVVTRQAPYPMLMYCNKLGKSYYVKVGFKGILHLAHAFYDKIGSRVYNLLWDRSYKQTCKKLGHVPTIKEAAKTTWLK